MDLQPWAQQAIDEFNAEHGPNRMTETILYEALLAEGASYSEAFHSLYIPDYEQFDDWREYVRFKKDQGWTYEHIALLVRGHWDRSCESEIRRLCDEEAAEKQRQHDRDYQARVRADPVKHEKQKARMRAYWHANKAKRNS